MDTSWFTISNAAEVASPALLVYPDRVEENIRRMIRMAGGAERLRPHIKTNKLPGRPKNGVRMLVGTSGQFIHSAEPDRVA